MKKLFVLLTMGLALFTLTTNAAPRYPDIIVNKHDGGWSALLNLYNDVVYTPSEGGDFVGTLDCSGLGYSACRVPRVNALGSHLLTLQVPNTAIESKLMDVVNDLIATSEKAAERGTLQGSASKTISVAGASRNDTKTFCVKCDWQYNSNGNAVIYIYLSRTDIYNRI